MMNSSANNNSFANIGDLSLTFLFDTLLTKLHEGEVEKPFQPSLAKPRRDYILALAHYMKEYSEEEKQTISAMRDMIMKTDHFSYVPEDRRISMSGLFSEAENDLPDQPCVSYWHSFLSFPEDIRTEAETSALVDLIQLAEE